VGSKTPAEPFVLGDVVKFDAKRERAVAEQTDAGSGMAPRSRRWIVEREMPVQSARSS
jgi:hypothetical protein